MPCPEQVVPIQQFVDKHRILPLRLLTVWHIQTKFLNAFLPNVVSYFIQCEKLVFTFGNPSGFDVNALLLLERPSPPNDKLFAFPLSALTTSRFLIFLKMFESSLIRAAEAIETVFRTRSFEHIEFLRMEIL